MPINNVSYPFDHTGVASTNLVQGERQIIPIANAANFVLIIPFAAPYFWPSLKVIHVPTGRTLSEGVDYYCTHRFYAATTKLGQPIYGSITMIDKTLSGTIDLEYQTVGGDWTLSSLQLQAILGQTLLDPRTAVWEQITELPYAFPPLPNHPHEVSDMTGMAEVIDALHAIAQSIIDSATGANESHIDDKNNPHETTAAQVGLGLVANFPPASALEASAGLAANRYMTPATVRVAILDQAGATLSLHIARTDNPHGVNKTQVGLSNVENLPLASVPEALAGTAQNRYMSPYLVKALVDAVTGGSVSAHAARTDNPHGVTKVHVGLGDVPNFPAASPQEAVDGTANDRIMTPYLVKTFFSAVIGNTVQNHIADQNNPHHVTKLQVGLGNVVNLPLATLAAALAGVDDSGYMTPRLVAAAMTEFIGGGAGAGLATHLGDTDNPHGVTAEQVGAYTTEETDGLLGNKLGLNATAQNAARLGGLTTEEIVQQAKNRFEWPAVNPIDVGDYNINEGVTYTLLGYYVPPLVPDPTNPPQDVIFYFTGGDKRDAIATPMYLGRLNLAGAITMEIQQISGELGGMEFGYTVEGGTGAVSIFVKSPPLRNAISVLSVSDPGDVIGITSAVSDTEPPGWTNAVFTLQDNGVNADAVPGELAFGYNPHAAWSVEPDTLLQMVNVIEDSGDAAAAEAYAADFISEYNDWIAQSAYGLRNSDAVLADELGWAWDAGVTGLGYTGAGTTLQTLRDPNMYQDYVFEVEISSTSTLRHSVGILAAGVRQFGRDYGIYVMRNPGGTTADSAGSLYPGGDKYKNLTVVRNPFQNDAIDLGSRTSGVTGSGNGWDQSGVCRVRVEKSGSILTIKTSQLGSMVIDNALTVTLDLDSSPELAIFKKPTAIGMAKFKQANAKFKVITRPGMYRPYVLRGTTAGNDSSTYNSYNGATWDAVTPMHLSRDFIKPGRLYYSELTKRLYYARRNGTLKLLQIEFEP